MAGLPAISQTERLRFNTGIGRARRVAGWRELQMMLYDGDGWTRRPRTDV